MPTAMIRIGLRREAYLIKDGVHELARGIAGKRPAGAVGAVRPGSQPEDQHARMWVAEAGHGPCPVFVITIRAPLLTSDLL